MQDHDRISNGWIQCVVTLGPYWKSTDGSPHARLVQGLPDLCITIRHSEGVQIASH